MNRRAPGAAPSPSGVHHVERVMGMAVSFAVVDDAITAEQLRPALEWLHWVEATFSTFRATSEISRIQTGELDPQDAHPHVREVLDLCDDLFVRSDGVFDCYARGHLDPAGVVKGWAVERAAAILEREGAHNFTINAGGDLVVRGRPSGDDRWRTGVRHPDQANEIVKVFTHDVTPMAVATSGSYERGDHVVDTRATVARIPRACRSATVVGADLTWADAYATVVFVMGRDGIAWLREQPGHYDAYVITNDLRALVGSTLGSLVGLG